MLTECVVAVFEKKGRSKLRALRWLSPSHLLLLVNRPNRSGVELQILRIYSEDGMGSIILRKTLGKGAKQAVDMDGKPQFGCLLMLG